MSEYVFDLSSFESDNIDDGLREEIVRCRDCEYFDTRKCKSQWPFCLDAFCWWGKRKEGDE